MSLRHEVVVEVLACDEAVAEHKQEVVAGLQQQQRRGYESALEYKQVGYVSGHSLQRSASARADAHLQNT